MDTAPNDFNWDIANKMELIDRMVSNLQKAPFSYRLASAEDTHASYYIAICDKCGWWDSSKLLDGGGQIGDTGDYGDCFCPVCGNANTDEVDENESEIDHQANRFITAFGKYAVEIIRKTKEGELYHPSQNELFAKVLEKLHIEEPIVPEPSKNRKKCIISRYDETITEPPYLTIPIDSIEVTQPENDEGGVLFAGILMRACSHKGYTFRFYTMSTEEGSDYNIVVC
jgi:hypothetical protein